MRPRRASARAAALVAALAAWGAVPAAEPSRDAYERAVVGLEVTYQTWDEDRPWAKETPGSRDASAVLVDATHLLTTAQMVDHATFINLATFGRGRQVEPRIVRVDPDINLALLAVDDPAVLADLKPLPLAERTPTSGSLNTVRWRGQQLESAVSRVTRFEVERSWQSRVEHAFLHMRTDISNGGWAEPVFQDGVLVGLTVSQTQQVSRAIPVEILRAFLDRARAPGPYVGFPALGVNWQVNRDAAVTRYLGQEGEPRGILVRQVPWGTSGCGVLKPRDILLEVEGHAIDAEGHYRHPRLGQVRFTHLLAERYRPGDVVRVKVFRGGRVEALAMTLREYPASLDLVPSRREGQPPYVIAGGLLLRELDLPYLQTWGKEWSQTAPVNLLTRYWLFQEGQTPERRRSVLISTVLPSEYNIGYQGLHDEVVESINGRSVGSLEDALAALAEPQGLYHVLGLSADSTRREVVLDAAALERATREILESYRIPEAGHGREEPLPPGGGDCPGDY